MRSPLATKCGPSSANIVCVERYASVMLDHFFRQPVINNTEISFGDTQVPSEPSFELIPAADFIVSDYQRGLRFLGPNPTCRLILNVTNDDDEAPIYVPSLNKLFLGRLSPGHLLQFLVDVNKGPPELSEHLSDPLVYVSTGGTSKTGLIYGATAGGNLSLPFGGEICPSIRILDPTTNKTTVLLNTYFGYYSNGPDDLAIHPQDGSIWFIDLKYTCFRRRTDTALMCVSIRSCYENFEEGGE